MTTYHLVVLHRGFKNKGFDEILMENVDATHFFINLDNGCTLGSMDNTIVKYAEVVSGGDSITMVIRIFWGVNQ